jgi:hypothetical protein
LASDRVVAQAVRFMKKLVKELKQRLLKARGDALRRADDRRGAAEIYARLADEFKCDGFFLKAFASIALAQSLDPQPAWLFRIAELYASTDHKADALAYLAMLPATLEVLKLKATLLPDDRETQLHLAEVLLDAGDEVGANAVLARVGVEVCAVREERRLAAIDFSQLN